MGLEVGLEVMGADGLAAVGVGAHLVGFVVAVVGIGGLNLVLALLYRARFRYFAWYVWAVAGAPFILGPQGALPWAA